MSEGLQICTNNRQVSIKKERKKKGNEEKFRRRRGRRRKRKKTDFFLQLKRRRNEKKKRKMKINTELTCWRKCSRKYPSNEKKKKKKKKKIRKRKKRKEKKKKKRKEKKRKKKLPDLFSGILQGFFFHKKCASNLLLCASILGVRLDKKVNYFPQGQIFRIYMYIYSKPYQIMIHDVLLYSIFFFFNVGLIR